MHLHWLIPGNFDSAHELSRSSLASARMRAGLVALHGAAHGISVTAGDSIDERADIVVVGKVGGQSHLGRSTLWLGQLQDFNNQAKRIVVDYTDNYLADSNSRIAAFYTQALPLADAATAPSEYIANQLAMYFHQTISVIEDPVEVPICPPDLQNHSGDMSLLWFGHATNIPYLVSYLENHELCDRNFKLIALSNAGGLQLLTSRPLDLRITIQAELVEWSLENMLEARRLCHGCLIPSDPLDPRKAGASSNRLITAFALGLPVLADAIPSYAPHAKLFRDARKSRLSEFCSNLPNDIRFINEAQKCVVPQYFPDIIFKKWKQCLLS